MHYIHAHFAAASASAAWAASAISGVPFGFTGHAHGLFRRRNPYLGAKIRAAALPIVIAEFHKQFIAERCGAEIAQRVQIVRCGVDLGQLKPQSGARSLDIVAVGRLDPMKGFDILIRAIELIPRPRPQCEIIGDGPMRRRLQRMIERLGLAETVQLRGALSNKETRERVGRAKMFVLPCRVCRDGNRDGLPVALMEALALETPAISTPVAAIPELIEDGRSGLLAATEDPPSLARCIVRLIDHPELAIQLAAEGRRRIEARHDARQNATRLEELIRSRTGARAAGKIGTVGGETRR